MMASFRQASGCMAQDTQDLGHRLTARTLGARSTKCGGVTAIATSWCPRGAKTCAAFLCRIAIPGAGLRCRQYLEPRASMNAVRRLPHSLRNPLIRR